MSEFKLKSEFKPTGDQPAAIKQLVDGLKAGEKNQTLLGVTGSGKSVTADTQIIVKSGQKVLNLSIGEFDRLFADVKTPLNEKTSQIFTVGAGDLQTLSFSPTTGTVTFEDVDQISRHEYTGLLYTVSTKCGRQNNFTDSHNVYVLRCGELKLVPSCEIIQGDYLPVPQHLDAGDSFAGVSTLDVRQWLEQDGRYIEDTHLNVEGSYLNRQKAWRISHQGERISAADYQVLQPIPSRSARISGVHRGGALPIMLELSRSMLRFLGLFIAEGHSTTGYITLSTADPSIANEFADGANCLGLPIAKRRNKAYDYQISSSTLAEFLRGSCGSRAPLKRLPRFWASLSNDQLGWLLSAVFAGDGGVEKSGVSLSSVSRGLISDIQTALLRFGINGHVRIKSGAYNGKPHTSWCLSITARDSLREFQSYIGFGLERKDQALYRLIQSLPELENTNVDVFPLSELVWRVCEQYGLTQQDIADIMGVSRSAVSLYWSKQRLPSRQRARRLLDYLRHFSGLRGDIWQGEMARLYGLTELFWSPVEEVLTKHTRTVVYDLSVPQNQTFLAGSYFVHNTFTMANLIQQVKRPTLVLSHNKTLAAQLYGEFKHFFPDNAVHYFVSYFDYYQPEAYIARSDTYIEKDSQINEEIDRLRHAATDALLQRRDVVIVASVSCIYGIGSPTDYNDLSVRAKVGERRLRDKLLRQLTDIQYQRNDTDFHRGTFRVRGDVVDIFPAGEELAYRLDFFGDEIERITQIDPLTGEILQKPDKVTIFPSSHYVTPQEKLKVALGQIEGELAERLKQFKSEGKLLEAQRLEQRTRFDLEMLEETGFVKGIENYSRYLTNREPGEQPATLLDYFPDDFLMLIDESHMTVPQLRAMYNGDRARKESLVEYGFRLPSALDNRPLMFPEFERHVNQVVYVSATPAEYELSRSPTPAEQVIRPTGLLDPPIEVRPVDGQVDDLIAEIRDTVKKHQRVLVTTLTKRMSEDLTEYLQELGIKVAYLHSDVDTLDRTDILRDLRLGVYDVLVGINLLREGLDLPEVSLVAILDADKEGFLRSEAALIQTVGRAARHEQGHVIMYADHITKSMQATIDETERRRGVQEKYNKEHGITPRGINRAVEDRLSHELPEEAKRVKLDLKKIPRDEYAGLLRDLTAQMDLASANLQFEQAAELRDLINDIKQRQAGPKN